MWIEWSGDKSTGDTVNHFNTQESGSKRFHFILFIEYQVTRLLWRWFLLLLFFVFLFKRILIEGKINLIEVYNTFSYFSFDYYSVTCIPSMGSSGASCKNDVDGCVWCSVFLFFSFVHSIRVTHNPGYVKNIYTVWVPFFCLLSFISTSFA